MKMIWAIMRAELAPQVIEALDRAGIGAMTRLHSAGPENDRPPCIPAHPGDRNEVLMIAIRDSDVAKTVKIIRAHARPPRPDPGDKDAATYAKIFITHIDEMLTIRNARKKNEGSGS